MKNKIEEKIISQYDQPKSSYKFITKEEKEYLEKKIQRK